MHEMSIAQGIVDIVREEMQKHNAKVLRSIRLNIGQMSAVVPESLSFCFKVITSGTELEGAELIMDIIPIRGYCPSCQKDFIIEDYAFECPDCTGTDIDVIGGQDLSIVELEVD